MDQLCGMKCYFPLLWLTPDMVVWLALTGGGDLNAVVKNMFSALPTSPNRHPQGQTDVSFPMN